MLNTSFSPWPSFTAEEADAVARVLLSNRVNYWTGAECVEFEREFAVWAGSRHAIALANGTIALEAALHGIGLRSGDEVIVTARSFLASASCIVMAGGRPVFADVDADSQNITADTIRAVLTPRTRAIICVHLAGWPCDMDPITDLAAEHGLKVIEDCAQAHGATYGGRPVGSLGHVAAWSFCQDKIMTTGGEGGMLTTDDDAMWSRMWSYKDHGKSWSAVHERIHPSGYRWLHESFGTNGRMLEMQAVIGRIQLGRMSNWSDARAANAAAITARLMAHEVVRVPTPPAGVQHAWYKLYAFVRPDRLRPDWTRDRIVDEISASGVPCYTGTCPEVYLEKAFDSTPFRPVERLPVSKELGETSLMFLVHPTLTVAEIQRTGDVVDDVLRRAAN